MAEISVIDPQSIENLRALNPGDNDEFLREIAGIFLEDTPLRMLNSIRMAAADVTKFTRAAPASRARSSNLGALAFPSCGRQAEHQARAHGLVDVAGLVRQVKLEFERGKSRHGLDRQVKFRTAKSHASAIQRGCSRGGQHVVLTHAGATNPPSPPPARPQFAVQRDHRLCINQQRHLLFQRNFAGPSRSRRLAQLRTTRALPPLLALPQQTPLHRVHKGSSTAQQTVVGAQRFDRGRVTIHSARFCCSRFNVTAENVSLASGTIRPSACSVPKLVLLSRIEIGMRTERHDDRAQPEKKRRRYNVGADAHTMPKSRVSAMA